MVAFVIVSVCWDGLWGGGGGVGQTDLVLKGSEIASHHGGVVTKGLEIPLDPVRSSHKGRSRKVLKFPVPRKCIQPYPCALLNTCRLGVEA